MPDPHDTLQPKLFLLVTISPHPLAVFMLRHFLDTFLFD